MRLGLIVLLCLVNAGCAIVRKDAEEPVDNTPRTAKAEPELKPSEVLQPKSLRIASPITDRFYMRGTYFPAAVTTEIRLDPNSNPLGTLLSAEDLDLGPEAQAPIVPLEKAKEDFQRRYVLEVLERNNGNRTQTARDLGVDPRTIFRYLEKEQTPMPSGAGTRE